MGGREKHGDTKRREWGGAAIERVKMTDRSVATEGQGGDVQQLRTLRRRLRVNLNRREKEKFSQDRYKKGKSKELGKKEEGWCHFSVLEGGRGGNI